MNSYVLYNIQYDIGDTLPEDCNLPWKLICQSEYDDGDLELLHQDFAEFITDETGFLVDHYEWEEI